MTRVGIVAPSSKVPEVEFEMGLSRLRESGFEPVAHPHTLKGHLFFAGTDEQRARAVWEMALDESVPIVWCARGGYGSARILPLLDAYAKKRRARVPKKLLIGFSDSTALLEYVRTRWGWATLHAPMPGLRQFCALPADEWSALVAAIRGESPRFPWQDKKLTFFGVTPRKALTGPLVGGNLAVFSSLVGTPYAIQARGKIVFFEDVDENLYRVDRMFQQILASGGLKGARAIVLGNFNGCRDLVPNVLSSMPSNPALRDKWAKEPDLSQLTLLRPPMDTVEALAAIFSEATRVHKIPVAAGLPVGHGPGKAPLPMGGTYELTPKGELRLKRWEWRGP
jgi:muramoyltetrapeptide carboxypeptidase